MEPTVPDLEPDLHWVSENIQQFIENESICEIFSFDQLVFIIKNSKLDLQQASQIFMAISKKFSPLEAFQLFQHTKIKLKNKNENIHDLLMTINVALKTKSLAKIAEYFFQLYNENLAVYAQNKLLSEKLEKLQYQIMNFQEKYSNDVSEFTRFNVDEQSFRTVPNMRHFSTGSSEFSSDNIEILPNDIKSLKIIIESKNQQINMMKTTIKYKDNDISTQLTSIQHLASQLSKFATESSENVKSQWEERMKIIESDINLLKQQHNNHENEFKKFISQSQESQKIITRLSEQYRLKSEEYQTTKNLLKIQDGEIQKLNKKLESLRDQNKDVIASNNNQIEIKNQNIEINELKQQNNLIKQELQFITNNYNQLQAEKEALTSEVKKLNETIEKLIGEESVLFVEAEIMRNYISKFKEDFKKSVKNEDLLKVLDPNSKSKIKRFRKDSLVTTMKNVRNEKLFNKICDYLIKYGEDNDDDLQFVAERGLPYISNKFHCIFFELAIQEKFNICSKLMQYGIDPNVKDSEGLTILHILTRRGCLEGLKIFAPVCNINQVASDGRTPLHIASHNGYIKIVSYLCSLENILFDIKDKNGKRPIDVAKNNTIVNIIKNSQSTM